MILTDARFIPSHTEVFFPSNDEYQYEKKLFTPYHGDSETVNYSMKSLRDYGTEIRRTVDYPARGRSTYYQPKVAYKSNDDYVDDYVHEEPVNVEKLFKESLMKPTYVKKVVPFFVKQQQQQHNIDHDNHIIQYYNDENNNKYSSATSVSQTIFKGSNVHYSW